MLPERSVTVRISAVDSFSTVVDRYQAKMGQAKTSTENMTTATDNSKSAMSQFTTAVKGVIGGLAVREVINFGVEMTNLGREVNLTKQRFEALVTPMGNAEDIMQRLRDASMGTASDQTLAEGSNLLMMTGIAKSPEDLENIISLITRTKAPTEDLNSAIQNFSLMLTNQSILRLDSFGISSGRVRQRIDELLKSGQALSRDEAFKMAVLEEGAKNIDRLGSSAEAAGTPLTRLETRLENLKNTGASNIATGVEGIIGITEIALGQHPEQQRQAQEAANLFAADFQMALQAALNDPALAGEDTNFVTDFMQRAIKKAQADPALANDAIALRNSVLADFGVLAPEAALGAGGGLNDMAQQINAMAQIAQYTVANNRMARETAASQAQQADEAAKVEAATERVNRLYQDMGGALRQGADLWGEMAQRATEAVGMHDQLMGGLGFLGEQAGGVQMGQFMSQEDADTLARIAQEAEATVKQMEDLDKANNQLFSDTELEYARGQAEALGQMADEAERAAQALANIKLTDIFGQTGGGTRGEVGDLVIEQMRAAGATEEQIAAYQRQMDLLSGRETTGSLALKDTIVPAITEITDDPEAMAQLSSAIADVLVGAAQQGIDPNDPNFINQLTGDLTTQGTNFDSETFLTNFTDLSDKAAAFQASMSTFLTDITTAQDPVVVVETAMGNISTFGANLQASLKELTSKVQEVKVKVKVEYDDTKGWLEQTVKNNGGKVPGATLN